MRSSNLYQGILNKSDDVCKDEMNEMKLKLKLDKSKDKIDVSAGVYRGEDSLAYTLPAIKEAKQLFFEADPGNDYSFTTGIEEYLTAARNIAFGESDEDVVSVQTLAGTGAVYLAIQTLISFCDVAKFYVGTPTWPNYFTMFEKLQLEFETYNHINEQSRDLDMESLLKALETCEPRSVFIFQVCCHNPTGCDPSKEQWKKIVAKLKEKEVFIIFDGAYLGLSSGSIKEDRWVIEYFVAQKMPFMLAQSFSKNLGLYSERVGALHINTPGLDAQWKIKEVLRSLIRAEYSSSPAYGARLFLVITGSSDLKEQWELDLKNMQKRLKSLRQRLLDLLQQYQTPGSWDSITKQKGLFWYSGLSKEKCHLLINKHHVYLPSSGRINIAGLNDGNIERFAACLDDINR